MIEVSGAGSGTRFNRSGSGRPKNIRILRIRIRNIFLILEASNLRLLFALKNGVPLLLKNSLVDIVVGLHPQGFSDRTHRLQAAETESTPYRKEEAKAIVC
jgi:hypothetical protein